MKQVLSYEEQLLSRNFFCLYRLSQLFREILKELSENVGRVEDMLA
jgi:hypothetical protein